MKKKIIAILLVILLISTFTFYASVYEAKLQILNLMDKLSESGWTLTNDFDYALINKGDTLKIRMTLYKNVKYIFAAAGGENAKDVNVRIYDESWKLLSKDNKRSIDAYAEITPKLTGTYHIVIELFQTRNNATKAHVCMTSGYN